MDVEVLFKIRQRSRTFGTRLAGEGMLIRLRRTSIALVGLVAGVGLGLTVFISQLGFPGVFNSPIPGNASVAGKVHDAIALTEGQKAGSPSHSRVSRFGGATTTGDSGAASGPAAGAGVGGSGKLAVSPATQSPEGQANPGVAQPPSAPVPEPTAQPAPPPPVASPAPPPPPAPAPASAPVTAAVGESPPKAGPAGGARSGSAAKSKSKSKSSGTAAAKATSDGSDQPEVASTASSKSSTGKRTHHSGPPSKSSGSPAEKAVKDQSASPPKAPAPASTAPPVKELPQAAGYAAKEAADTGKSDRPHR